MTSRGREEGRLEVEVKVHMLAQEVQRLTQGEPEGAAGGRVRAGGRETGRLRDELWVEEHRTTLLHRRLTQAEQQRGELTM